MVEGKIDYLAGKQNHQARETETMSAYTTLKITRSRAKRMVIDTILEVIEDDELAEYTDKLLEPRLYNTMIVPDGCENDDQLTYD